MHSGVIAHEILHGLHNEFHSIKYQQNINSKSRFVALGFHHMQSSSDRDDYVKIQWENIQENMKYNFDSYSSSEVTRFNTPYDYYSVMHYYQYAFSKNNKPTILPLVTKTIFSNQIHCSYSIVFEIILFFRIDQDEKYSDVIGSLTMSDGDITRLNKMYEC